VSGTLTVSRATTRVVRRRAMATATQPKTHACRHKGIAAPNHDGLERTSRRMELFTGIIELACDISPIPRHEQSAYLTYSNLGHAANTAHRASDVVHLCLSSFPHSISFSRSPLDETTPAAYLSAVDNCLLCLVVTVELEMAWETSA
jgi:hypothetical protein